MKKYMTGSTRYQVSAKITEIEVDRETESSVWVKGVRRQKVTEYAVYHNSWDDAHSYLLAAAGRKVEYARKTLEEHRSYLGNVQGMAKPREVT